MDLVQPIRRDVEELPGRQVGAPPLQFCRPRRQRELLRTFGKDLARGFAPVAVRVYNEGGGLYGVAVGDIKASCCDCIVHDTFEMHAFRVFYVSYVAASFSCGQPGWPWVRLGWVGAADVTEEMAAFDPAMDEEIALAFVWRWGRQAAKFSVVGGGGVLLVVGLRI